MNEFVHTFCLKKLLPSEEFVSVLLKRDDLFFYVADEMKWVLKGYEGTGIRAELKALDNDSALRRYDSAHPRYEIETVVTPSRLLGARPFYSNLTAEPEKMKAACAKLWSLTDSIREATGIDLLGKAKLYRVDVTKDILTPSDLYSHEIIKAAKQSLNNRNYRLYNPAVNLNCVVYWRREDSMMFNGRKFWAKIYNKKRDMSLNREYEQELEALEDYGLLRFEISLLRDFLRDSYGAKGFAEREKLSDIICAITADAPSLMKRCFVKLFYKGSMVSRGVMKRYFERKRKKGQWSRTAKRMLKFSDWITHTDPETLHSEEDADPLWDGFLLDRFETIGLSPVHVDKRCPYIPSFSDMLDGAVDKKLLRFAEDATKRKRSDIEYWTV